MTLEHEVPTRPAISSVLQDRAVGALTASAIGDALGGATEGFSPRQIRDRWGGWVLGVVDPYHGQEWRTVRPMSPWHKGDGHTTDDTIMTQLLASVYVEQERHLDAYDIAEHLVDKMLHHPVWIPEMNTESVPIIRVFLAEKYLALRLHFGNVDPREAGVGNMVNCGAAMYMAPAGLVNGADPDAAYAEGIELASAHQSSYGREAAGVLAAAVAAAATVGAGVADVVETALRLARDGTKRAIGAVVDAAASCSSWQQAIESGVLRDAVRPYDTVGEPYRAQHLGARRPSRIHSIEELPIALAMLVITGGDVREAILGGVNYGRDSDSIASMAGSIAGALGGSSAVPVDLLEAVSEASQLDLLTPAATFGAAATRIRTDDLRTRRLIDERTRGVLAEIG